VLTASKPVRAAKPGHSRDWPARSRELAEQIDTRRAVILVGGVRGAALGAAAMDWVNARSAASSAIS